MADALRSAMLAYKERFGDQPQIGPRMSREEFLRRVEEALSEGVKDQLLSPRPFDAQDGRTAIPD